MHFIVRFCVASVGRVISTIQRSMAESASDAEEGGTPKKGKKWGDYPAMGTVIEGTRFICFKAPMDRTVPSSPDHGTFTSEQVMNDHVPSQGRTLGMVVDLTDTYKFYSPYDAFEAKQVKHYKIFCPGFGDTPAPMWTKDFGFTVSEFLKKTRGIPDVNGEETLVGVHCMNGVNRTGFFVCKYLIHYHEMPPGKAIKIFEDARGCPIDNKAVVEAIKKLTPCKDGNLPPPKKK